jgi:hypothetical protein
MPHDSLPRGPSYLHHVLVTLKNLREDHFREQLCLDPTTFDALVSKIKDDPVFMNQSNNPQMPVEEQLAITLFCFGHDSNSFLQKVANWAGIGKGTVTLATWRVMTAVLHPDFMHEAVHFPSPEEKEAAKHWVHQCSCRTWRNGLCFFDGTLILLAT